MKFFSLFPLLLFLASSHTVSTEDIMETECDAETGECTTTSSSSSAVAADAQLPKGANAQGKPREVLSDCADRHSQCAGFMRNNACVEFPGWMIVNCPKSCDPINNACALRDPKVRCQREHLNMSRYPIYAPGDLDNMFRNISTRFGDRYDIKIWSEQPWVITFEDFLTAEEADAIVSTQDSWERSTDTGSTNAHGETGRVLSNGRTSANSWCRGRCESDPLVQNAMRKIEEVTMVPRENYESFQVLRYEVGQRYARHHDYGAGDVNLACGPRILTFFLYLSDVEAGGETAFPQLRLSVAPKKGRALLWPSVLSNDPELIDARTSHEAKAVAAGTKYAANAWIHLYNYAVPNLWGCTGTFDEI